MLPAIQGAPPENATAGGSAVPAGGHQDEKHASIFSITAGAGDSRFGRRAEVARQPERCTKYTVQRVPYTVPTNIVPVDVFLRIGRIDIAFFFFFFGVCVRERVVKGAGFRASRVYVPHAVCGMIDVCSIPRACMLGT